MGCRRVRSKAELCRFVASSGALLPDPRHDAPGRGAYLCPDPRCFQRALKRGGLARALGVPGTDAATLTALTRAAESGALAAALAGARRGGIAVPDVAADGALRLADGVTAPRLRAWMARVDGLAGVLPASRDSRDDNSEGRAARGRTHRLRPARRDGMDPRPKGLDPAGDE